jgi:hypothetical protein
MVLVIKKAIANVNIVASINVSSNVLDDPFMYPTMKEVIKKDKPDQKRILLTRFIFICHPPSLQIP